MKYTVVWLPDAESELAKLFLQITAEPGQAQAFSNAANYIDAELRNQPQDIRQKIDQLRGLLFQKPLAVAYRIYPDDRLVQVTAVWLHDSSYSNL